jgi:nitrate reductase (cytochrome), electron transfer subunit
MHRTVLLLSLCAAQLVADPPVKVLTDRDLGLSHTSVFEVPAPPPYHDEASAPGEKALPKRINREYPPVIPHGIVDCLPITQSSNLCMDCHAVPGPKKKGEATPVPASHYVDLRRAPDAKGKQIAGSRYVCITCHVPTTDAPPIAGSTYRP